MRNEHCPICGLYLTDIPDKEPPFTCSGAMLDQEHDPYEMETIGDEGFRAARVADYSPR